MIRTVQFANSKAFFIKDLECDSQDYTVAERTELIDEGCIIMYFECLDDFMGIFELLHPHGYTIMA